MNATIDFLKGKKSYLILAVLGLAIVVEGVLGIDVPGVDVTPDDFLRQLSEVGLGFTFRAAIGKAEVS